MQDRYAGDVGDFSKFALIKALAKHMQARVGVIWYAYPDESHTSDGKHISYAQDRRWLDCDQELTQRLGRISSAEKRSIRALEQADILPAESRYFSKPMSTVGQGISVQRQQWFREAMEAVAECGLVFVDPDNGIAGRNHVPNSRLGGKHITHAEIQALAEAHNCLGIYHHFDRTASHKEQISRWTAKLRLLSPACEVDCLRYKRISPRAYFLVYKPQTKPQIQAATQELVAHPWDVHFERV